MALYNKYRPKRLSEVAGQDHVKQVLASQVSKDEVVHAYLFTGPAGTGKTSVARILAAMVNCSSGPTTEIPDDDPYAETILRGSEAALDVIEIDAATNRKIDDIRALRQKLNYAPAMMRRKVVIMDECHQLTDESWEALLKILEEPPPYALFILCTTEPQKVTETVKTRCMVFDFRPISMKEVATQLSKVAKSEKIHLTSEALAMLANSSRGSLRLGISRMEKLKHVGGEITADKVSHMIGVANVGAAREFLRSVVSKDYKAALTASSSCLGTGIPASEFLTSLAEVAHDLLMAGKSYDLESHGYTAEEAESMRKLKSDIISSLKDRQDFILLIRKWVRNLDTNSKMTVYNLQPQFHADFVFVEMWDIYSRVQRGKP